MDGSIEYFVPSIKPDVALGILHLRRILITYTHTLTLNTVSSACPKYKLYQKTTFVTDISTDILLS